MDGETTNTEASATDDDRAFKRDDGWWGVRGLPPENYYDEHTARRIARQLSHDADQVDDVGETDEEQDQRIARELAEDDGAGDGGG